MLRLRHLVVAIIGAILAPAALSQVQAFPSKVVRITSTYSAGFTADVGMRIIASKLAQYWGQQVIVEPRPGANGFLAMGAVKKAAADGHVLLLLGNGHLSINPNLFKNAPNAPEDDFVRVSLIYRVPFFLIVLQTGPYQTIGALIAAAKAAPGTISYSTPYIGSPTHLGGAMFQYLTGTQMLAVHFKEGPAAFTSVANGDISFTLGSVGSVSSLVKAGKLRMLAVVSASRFANEPNIPTVREAGGPAELEVDVWSGLVAPRGTPMAVANRISADVARALSERDVRERYYELGVVPTATTPAEMAGIIRSELKRYGDLVKKIGIQAE